MAHFDTILLSAQRVLTPPIGSALSGTGVNIITLSGGPIGVVFNARTDLSTVLVNTTVLGCVLRIDRAYSTQQMALVNVDNSYTLFQFISSLSVGLLSGTTLEVSTPDTQRKYLLGYR